MDKSDNTLSRYFLCLALIFGVLFQKVCESPENYCTDRKQIIINGGTVLLNKNNESNVTYNKKV